MNYTITTFDVCAQGMERLRNRDEFLLVGHVQHDTTNGELVAQFLDDIQACDRPVDFDYDACRTTVLDFMATVDMARALKYIDPPTDDDDDGSGCCAFLYVREWDDEA